jgi:hypothetical protein
MASAPSGKIDLSQASVRARQYVRLKPVSEFAHEPFVARSAFLCGNQ